MFRSIYQTCIPVLVLIIFGLQVIFSSPDTYAQGMFKTADVPGGSGSTTQSQNTSDDGTTLIIVGAVIIAGFLVYKLVINKDEPKKEEKQDSTSQQSLLLTPERILSGSKHAPSLTDIPVNIYMGFKYSDTVLCERKFIMGISYKF